MKQTIGYNPLPYQRQFHNSKKPKVYLSAGYGAGKTYSLVMKLFQLMDANTGLAGGILAPSLKMFKRDLLPTITDICNKFGIRFRFNKSDFIFHFPDTDSIVYVFHAEDHGQSIRGPNLAFMLINEVTLISKETFDAALARVRLKKANLLQVAMSGTPEGFNWTYEYFVENLRDDTDFIFGDMRLNKYISDDYVKILEESYDSTLIEQYVEGKFVNAKGNRAVYTFVRKLHTDSSIEQIHGLPIWVTLDFNVDPMTATLWNKHPSYNKILLTAFDEIILYGSNTPEMCVALRQRIQDPSSAVLYPDPAGKSRSTKSYGQSDMDFLRQAGFGTINYRNKSPRVRDALNALNNLFDKNRVIINPKRCKNLVADLEQCTIKPETYELDKSNPKRTHSLDGAKYMAEYEFSIRRPKPVREIKIR